MPCCRSQVFRGRQSVYALRTELVPQQRIVLLTLIDCNLFRGRNSGLCCVENSHKLRQRHVSNASMQASSGANTRVSAILWRSE